MIADLRSSGNGVFQTLKAVTSGILGLAIVFFAYQLTGEGTNHSSHGVGDPGIELADQHRGDRSHEPGSGSHDEICSVTACASFTMTLGRSDYLRIPSPNLSGLAPTYSMPKDIVLAGEPPIPRLLTF